MSRTEEDIDVAFFENDRSEGHPLYPGFKPGSTLLKHGHVNIPGALPLPCDILWERDVAVHMRDGVKIHVDVYRPPTAKEGTVPAIIAGGPFGKNGGLNRAGFAQAPWRNGVPQRSVSSFEKFEGPDPAYWCNHGYAIVHPDQRGTWRSEGNLVINCTLDGQDGYDLIEWIAQQPWSNGKVSLAGNSWLSQTQWFIGAERPPHLACLAPWEGWSDLYNDNAMRGGIPNPEFQQSLMTHNMPGLGKAEDVHAMSQRYPLWNSYWEDRKAKVGRIQVPIYITASWTNFLHTRGTFRGWLECGSSEKWLRVHNSHEWPDLYYPQNTEDLRKFYDYYMKGILNDWPYTPKVRLCIPNPGGRDIINRPETEFPLSRQESRQLFLHSSGELSKSPQSGEEIIQYEATTGKVSFIFKITENTELTGYFKLKLWVEADGSEEMDIFTVMHKLDKDGTLLEPVNIDVGWLADDPEGERQKLHDIRNGTSPSPFNEPGEKVLTDLGIFFGSGSTGRLRVSHRELDMKKSTAHQPYHTHLKEQLLSEGEIVPVEIEMWPHGMLWEPGQMIRLDIAGHNMCAEGLPWIAPPKTKNKGRHIIHVGGKYDSHLLVPFIPSSLK